MRVGKRVVYLLRTGSNFFFFSARFIKTAILKSSHIIAAPGTDLLVCGDLSFRQPIGCLVRITYEFIPLSVYTKMSTLVRPFHGQYHVKGLIDQ